MGFFQDLFGIGKKRDVRQTTDDELNAILVPLRDAVADFKDRTQISHTHILPAINSIGALGPISWAGVSTTALPRDDKRPGLPGWYGRGVPCRHLKTGGGAREDRRA
jgi:hypothetical protein